MTVGVPTMSDAPSAKVFKFDFKRNVRSSNPEFLMLEGKYATQAAWKIDAKTVTIVKDSKPAAWVDFTVFKLEHATLLSLGAVAAATSSALLA